jgi:RHS repeat-associated protein
MKKFLFSKKQILSVIILFGFLSLSHTSYGQSVMHPYGQFCVGQTNVFAYGGPGTVTGWYVGGGGTITSNSGSSITVQWNSTVVNTYVTAYYYTSWSSGSTSYNNITISSSVTPSVTISANNNNICEGSSVTFTASPINGGSSPYYYWYINGSYIAAGYSNTFSTSSLTNGQQVTCVMNTSAPCYTTYSATSNAITMNVNSLQTMGVTISGNTSICQGSPASFVANVTNSTGNLSYQWKKNGNNITSDAIGAPPYVFSLNSFSNNDVFSCVVSTTGCAYPATSNSLTVSIAQPQTFSVGPAPSLINFCQGATANFTASSTHVAYNYQWYINGSPVNGANSSTFSTTATSVSQLQSISVTANTNASCVSNSSATGSAQYIPFVVNPVVTPTVSIIEPSVVILGSPAVFTANAVNGGNSPTYQWQLNSVNVSGATGSTYTPTITSGAQYQNIGVIMNSTATCAVNPATASNYIEIASAYWENLNYVRIHTTVASGMGNWIQVDGLATGDKFQSTTYLDGLSRPIQSVDKQISQLEAGGWTDMVTHVEYDAVGRIEKSFVPFSSSTTIGKFKTSAKTEQETFVRNKYGEDVNAPTYAKTTFEQSPLSRITNAKAAGTGFGGDANYQGNSGQYELNSTAEGVRIWTIDFAPNSIPYTTAVYSSGKLSKSVLLDEKQKKVYVYTDFEGKTILKKVQDEEPGTEGGFGLDENGHRGWLCTYYVYDDLGQLRTTITPLAVKYLTTTSWVFTSTDVYQELCYSYEFDERGRIIVKHSPGAGQIELVYDKKDRLVLSQDENQRNRSSKQWSFFLYDELNRSIANGLFDNTSNRAAMADHVKFNLNNGNVAITAYTGSGESINVDNPVAGNSTYCNNCTNTVINTVQYYESYGYSGVKSYNTIFSFPSTSNPYVETTAKTDRYLGFSTGAKTRVIDQNYNDNNPNNDLFLISTTYYDEKGRLLQSLSGNIKNGTDYTTMQYDFSGKVLGVCDNHTFPGSAMSGFEVISKYEYNVIGQLIKLSKKYGTQDYKKLAEYSYDEYGRIKNKKLSPDYNSGAGLENLKYDYNIQGWLTGINKDYALANTSFNQWDHFFGLYLGYDNSDNRFTAKQYNGNITGALWKTQGDNMPRKYDYQYDNVNRFKAATFVQKEKPADATWSSTKMDFSVTDILYDANSNLLQMYQKGIMPGNNNPVFIDKLVYEYKQVGGGQWSNQLTKVFDQTTDLTATNNGMLGDFKDENFGINSDDYSFDWNGNLVKDNNKKIRIGSGAGVEYNFMDKPQKVTLENKSVIEFIYDGTGEKIGKKVTYTPTNTSKTTWYDGDYIYEESNSVIQLKTILHEEGRIRVFEPISNPRLVQGGNFSLPGTNTKGVFEFFIKDNLQSVRMVLTEETHSEYNDCTMETANNSYEEKMFGQVDANGNPITGSNEVILTRKDKATFAPGWTSNTSANVSRLKQDDQKLGPNMMLKVMGGDVINAQANYYYTGTVDNTGSSGLLGSILTNLVTTLTNTPPTQQMHGSASVITTNYSQNPGDLGGFLSSQNNGGSTTPQAYLNVVFFDENFNFVPYDPVTGLGSYGWRVTTSGDGHAPLVAPNIKAPKNGYAMVYLSNESKTPVYFDDFAVTHVRGRIVEENAYYPYGLKIKGISAKAIDKGENKYGYQGEFAEDEEETGWDEFDLRTYDPQIGRWNGMDPYEQFASPYIGIGSDPINNIDPDGGYIGTFMYHATFTVAGSMVGGIIGALTSPTGQKLEGGLRGAGFGAAAGLGASFVNWDVVGEAFERAGGWVNEFFQTDVTKYFVSADAAAIHWGRQFSQRSIDEPAEYASFIYEIEKKGTKYYRYTAPTSFKNPEDRKVFSPAPDHSGMKNKVPRNATTVGHIHSHPDLGIDPLNFSPKTIRGRGDMGNHELFPLLDFYMTIPNGQLKVDRQTDLFENGYWRTDSGIQTLVQSGLGVSYRFKKGKLVINYERIRGSHNLDPVSF